MNILICGLGSIGWKHVEALNEIDPSAKIYALRSGTSFPENKNADIINLSHIEEIKAEPDFCIISTPTYKHAESIRTLIPLESPLMIEKPVLNTLKDSESISGEIDDRGIITYVACNLRFHPAICFLKENLRPAEKKINEVNIYCGSYLPDWRPGRDFRTLYSADESKGGGVHLDLIHEIDYCIWIFGFPQKTSSVKTKNSTLAINAIDYAHYLFEYADFTASITLNYFRKDSKRQIEILFEDGTWTVDLIKSTIVDDNQKIIFESELRMKNTYKMQLEYFIKQVNNKRQPMNDFKEALNVLEIALS